MTSAAARLPSRPQVGEISAMRQAEEEAGGIEIAGAGGIDQPRHRGRRDRQRGASRHDDRALLAPRQGRDLAMAAHGAERRVEILGLVERADFGLVGEEDVDMAGDERAELGAVALDAEGVGQGQADLAPGAVGELRRLLERRLGARWIEQVALEIGHLCRGDERFAEDPPARTRRRRRERCSWCAARRASPG